MKNLSKWPKGTRSCGFTKEGDFGGSPREKDGTNGNEIGLPPQRDKVHGNARVNTQ